MENNTEPLNSRSKIFSCNKDAIKYIDDLGLLESIKKCSSCGCRMIKERDTSYSNDYRLRCESKDCRKSKPIFDGLKISSPKIDIKEYLFIVYSWLEKNYEYNINKNTSVSLNTVKRIKRNLLEVCRDDNLSTLKKLGPENAIQVDESVVIKGKLIRAPSEMYDKKVNSTWLIGAVEEVSRELILQVIHDRKKETFLKFFQDNIRPGSIIKSDGHRSYPYAVTCNNCEHRIVNHQEGFTNKDGDHTNLIECEWSQFKSEIKTRKGIPGFAIKGYVEEYIWRRRNLKGKNANFFKIAFVRILELLCQKK